MRDWDAMQYLKFERERTQPAIDLAARISSDSPERIADIGCGPGNSTRVLAKRFPGAHILGADKSAHMVQTAKKNHADLDFTVCDAQNQLHMLGGGFDVVFSNACIQWIPNHPQLLLEMMSLLRPGGVLAVQVPMQMREPIHLIIREVTESAKWKGKLRGERIFYTLRPEEYFDRLCQISADFDIWETIYYHRLASPEEIMQWYRGTGLRPYLTALDESEREAFEGDVFKRVREEYPMREGGVIFKFPRLFFTAVR